MTRIKARCPICGEVTLIPKGVRLTLSLVDPTYAFDCPLCYEHITKPADERIIKLLVAAGVTPSDPRIPAEALEEHTGPAITADDVLTFHELLGTPDWFNHLCLLGPYRF